MQILSKYLWCKLTNILKDIHPLGKLYVWLLSLDLISVQTEGGDAI